MARTLDLLGRTFGTLTVIQKLDERENGYCVWLCQCSCGKQVKANTKNLTRGNFFCSDCTPKNNAKKGPVAEDLTGQRFGKLQVLERAENKKGRTAWLCQCDCGNLKTVLSRDLKAGKVRSCGCLSHRIGRGMKNITGRRFGNLTALYPTDRRDEKGSVYWHCQCDCGNETEVPEDGLVWGNYQSCGCRKREAQSKISQQLTRIDGTCIEILERRKYRRDNKSGFRGVFRLKNGKYRVSIGFKGKRFNVGTFPTFEEAVEARLEAEHLIHEEFLKKYYEWKELAVENPGWEKEHPLIFHVEKVNGRIYCLPR